jgi:hypothetical protein
MARADLYTVREPAALNISKGSGELRSPEQPASARFPRLREGRSSTRLWRNTAAAVGLIRLRRPHLLPVGQGITV